MISHTDFKLPIMFETTLNVKTCMLQGTSNMTI